MITLYSAPAPSGRIVSMVLEELGVPYEVVAIDLKKGEQKTKSFLELNPNGKIPVIIDRETGLRLAETGPIIWYLAERTGRMLPDDPVTLLHVRQWVSWAQSGLGPMLVQLHHFRHFMKGVSDYAENRYAEEAIRLYTILDRQLAGRDYIAGAVSLADFTAWPWISRFGWQGMNLGDYPNLRAWYVRMAHRPSVAKGYHVPRRVEEIPLPE